MDIQTYNPESEKANDYLKELSNYTFTSKYPRYNPTLKRRNTFEETIDLVREMHIRKYKDILSDEDMGRIEWAFKKSKDSYVLPAMRSLQFAGPAIEAHHARLYNCSMRHIDSIRSFAEIFYLLMCGSGVSFGLNKKYMSRLPDLVSREDKTGSVVTYVIEDSIEGWADSIESLLMCYFRNTPYSGRKIVFDYSRIRKKGEPLKTSGGKAPGHEGLKQSLQRIKDHLDFIIEKKQLKRLRSVDIYDIIMHLSDAVLSGGIRRAATMAIFEPYDLEMKNAKGLIKIDKYRNFHKDDTNGFYEGFVWIDDVRYEISNRDKFSEFEYEQLKKDRVIAWHRVYPWRARSNNSMILKRGTFSYEDFKEIFETVKLWGEPGFLFADHEDTLFNPCAEVVTIPVTESGVCGVQMCNLVTQNGAKIDTIEKFLEAVEAATIIGTLQAGYTDFRYLGNASKQLTEEEALLGVSITGIYDNPDIFLNERNLHLAAKWSVEVNKKWSEIIGINQASRTTLVKPEGTASLVLQSASGVHPHHAKPKYFRRIQANRNDPVYQHFKKINPHMIEESVWSSTKTDDVITFPVEINDHVKVKADLTAIEHLNDIRKVYENWVKPGTTETNKKPLTHNVSATVIVKDEEWDQVAEYVFENQNSFGGLSFISSMGDKMYKQAPLEKVETDEDLKRWEAIVSDFKKVDYTTLNESEDNTARQEEAACAGGACSI